MPIEATEIFPDAGSSLESQDAELEDFSDDNSLEAVQSLLQDQVGSYLKAIGQFPLLTAKQEVDLAKDIELGRIAKSIKDDPAQDGQSAIDLLRSRAQGMYSDEEFISSEIIDLKEVFGRAESAWKKFIVSNLRLVVSIAKKYQDKGLPLEDLIQEGNIGLMRGVDKFDYKRGFKFSTYATWWIRQSITRAIADKSRTVRVPVHMHENMNRVKKVRKDLELGTGREPTLEEVAKVMEMTPEKVREIELYNIAAQPGSLDAHIGDDPGNISFAEGIEDADAESPEEVAITTLCNERLVEVMRKCLNYREFKVLALRNGLFSGEPQTLETVGEEFSLTRERIRQIEAKALSRLRHPSVSSQLYDD